MRYERISNTSTLRHDSDNDRPIHVTGRGDVSPSHSTYLHGRSACGWCHVGAPHSTDAHERETGVR